MCRLLGACSVPLLDKRSDRGVGLPQGLFIRQKHDAEMLSSGLLAEAGSVDDHDMFLADEFLDENLVALWNVDSRIRIERAAR